MNRHLTSLVQNKLQRDASLNDEGGRYWAEIVDRRYQFDVAQREVRPFLFFFPFAPVCLSVDWDPSPNSCLKNRTTKTHLQHNRWLASSASRKRGSRRSSTTTSPSLRPTPSTSAST